MFVVSIPLREVAFVLHFQETLLYLKNLFECRVNCAKLCIILKATYFRGSMENYVNLNVL